MGFFDFARNAGEKIFGGDDLDENKIRDHILAQGLDIKPFSVVVQNAKEGLVSLIGYARSMQDKEKAIITAGNVKGVEKVDDRIRIGEPDWMKEQAQASGEEKQNAPVTAEQVGEPSADEAPTARFYTVESGDNLSKIAKEMYGSASKYPAIFEANKPMLSDPDKIYPGQVLRIPPLD